MLKPRLLLMFLLLIVSLTANSQKLLIDISLKNVTLAELVSEIERQTGYTFMYDNTLNEHLRFTIAEKKLSIDAILTKVFYGKSIDYAIVGTQIILKKKFRLLTTQQQYVS